MITAQQAAQLSLANIDHDFSEMIRRIENDIETAASQGKIELKMYTYSFYEWLKFENAAKEYFRRNGFIFKMVRSHFMCEDEHIHVTWNKGFI